MSIVVIVFEAEKFEKRNKISTMKRLFCWTFYALYQKTKDQTNKQTNKNDNKQAKTNKKKNLTLSHFTFCLNISCLRKRILFLTKLLFQMRYFFLNLQIIYIWELTQHSEIEISVAVFTVYILRIFQNLLA